MDTQIKGYVIVASCKFAREQLGARVPAATLAELAEIETTTGANDFFPRTRVVKVWNAVAAAGANEEDSYELLVQCGRAISQYATTTYMKLLLKVLTPRMFARKFPDFFARDFKGGQIVIEAAEERRLAILFTEVGDLDHIGAICGGFIGTTFELIGVKGLEVLRTNWSLAKPNPDSVRLELRWQ